jgi:hypothetical protein
MSMRKRLTAFSSDRGYKGWSRTRLYGSRRLSTRESISALACGPLRMPAAIGAPAHDAGAQRAQRARGAGGTCGMRAIQWIGRHTWLA